MHAIKKWLLPSVLAVLLLIASAPVAAADSPYSDWKQYDPRWADVVLTDNTMGQVGCLATSLAILAVHAGLRDAASFDPGVFVAEMKKAGGFNADNDLVWKALPKAVPGFTVESPGKPLAGTQAEKAAKLGEYLDDGFLAAVAVKDGGHWVALHSVADGRAVMMDPNTIATDLFAEYPAEGVVRVALLRAGTPKPTLLDRFFACLKGIGGWLLAMVKSIWRA